MRCQVDLSRLDSVGFPAEGVGFPHAGGLFPRVASLWLHAQLESLLGKLQAKNAK